MSAVTRMKLTRGALAVLSLDSDLSGSEEPPKDFNRGQIDIGGK